MRWESIEEVVAKNRKPEHNLADGHFVGYDAIVYG